jgi:hypothetical protein
MYIQSDLDALWTALQHVRPSEWGVYSGLQEVPFTIPLAVFEKRHERLVRQGSGRGMCTAVCTHIPTALEELAEARIWKLHLSCAGEVNGGAQNTALCIHYTKHHAECALALPGIDYLATQTTREQIERAYSTKR